MDEKDRARHAATHRRGLVEMANAGDTNAGMAMLQHAKSAMLRASQVSDEADAVALAWMAKAITQFFDGTPLSDAMAVKSSGGRPKKPPMLKALEDANTWAEVERLEAVLTQGASETPRTTAVSRVARRMGVSTTKVRDALTEHAAIQRKRAKQNIEADVELTQARSISEETSRKPPAVFRQPKK